MTLNQLRYFCMASRCHSITKAAEELYVTQPTVSVAIRDLEIEFGVSLFSRKGNQLILTREGEEFYQKANYILQYCNELQADYSNLSRAPADPHWYSADAEHRLFSRASSRFFRRASRNCGIS